MSTATAFPPSVFSCSLSPSCTALSTLPNNGAHMTGKEKPTLSRVTSVRARSLSHIRRSLSICLTTTFLCSLIHWDYQVTNAAILEAEDDLELLEKVKNNRRRRIERQKTINSSFKEKEYLQELIYKLNRVGEALDKNDLSIASSILGSSTDSDWVQNANIAFTKLSFNSGEKSEADHFKSSLASLVASVVRNDVRSSKIAFAASGSALEKWITLTGLVDDLKGL